MITVVGQLLDPLGHSHHGTKIKTAEVRSKQEALIPLTVDHSRVIGRVVSSTMTGGSV
jgi:hypothetical protein